MPHLINRPCSLLAGVTLVGLGLTPLQAAEIHGTVTAEHNGRPLAEASVALYQWRPRGEYWNYVADTYPDSESGGFSFEGVPAGTYYVHTYPYDGRYIGEYYDDTTDFDAKQEIVLGAEDDVILNPIEIGLRPLFVTRMDMSTWEVPPEGERSS